MSNVNNWKFADIIDDFYRREVDYLRVEIERAQEIVENTAYNWKDDKQKQFAIAKYNKMKERYAFINTVYDEGKNICSQHENIVNNLCKWYERWYNDVSNEGKQETEIMNTQADILNEIFCEIYKEIQPLKLEIKAPLALNLK